MQLRNMIEHGFRLNVYCQARDPETGQPCYHHAEISVPSLIQRFGWEFEISSRHKWFLRQFVCARCGAREATVRIQNPPHIPDRSTQWIW